MVGTLPLFLVSAQKVALDRELDLTTSRLGLAIGATFTVMALVAPALGRILSALPAPFCLRAGALTVSVALGALGLLASEWWHVVVILGFAGVGNAIAQVSSSLALSSAAAAGNQGLGFGIKQAAIPLASLVAGVAVPLVGFKLGWRVTCGLGALAALGMVLYRPRLTWVQNPRQDGAIPVSLRKVLVLIGLGGFLASAIGNSLPAFAVDAGVSLGWSERNAALLLATGSLAAVAARIASGIFADRRESSGVGELAALTGMGSISFAVLAVGGQSDLAFGFGLICAFATAWGWAGLLYYAGVRILPLRPGPVTGYLIAWVAIGNVVGPIAIGALIERTGYREAWAVSTLCLALTFAAMSAAWLKLRMERLGSG